MSITFNDWFGPGLLARVVLAGRNGVRRAGLSFGGPTLGRLLHRACFGHWPSPDENRVFTAALRERSSPLPPAMRAMLRLPAGRVQLGSAMLADMAIRGLIPGAEPGRPLPTQCGDPLAFWHGPPISFLHLEKTAGVSMTTLLTGLFHPEQIDQDPTRTIAPHVSRRFSGRSLTDINRRALVYGHYDLPTLRQLASERVIVTLLRDPMQRILSLYYYWRNTDLSSLRADASFKAVEMTHHCTLLEFLGSEALVVRNHIDNLYARRLTGFYGSAHDDLLVDAPDRALSAALAGLETIDFVGVTEHMHPSVAALSAYLGFAPPATIPWQNTTRVTPHEPLTSAHWQHLTRLTRFDAIIYRAGLDRLAQGGRIMRPLRLAAE